MNTHYRTLIITTLVALGASQASGMKRPFEDEKPQSEQKKQKMPISQEQANADLLEAARIGNREKVREALENGAHIKTTDKDLKTALHIASAQGHLQVVELLLAKGADIDEAKEDNTDEEAPSEDESIECDQEWAFTPLHFACKYGHLEIVKFLLQKGANLVVHQSGETGIGTTPLHIACECNREPVVAFLLDHIIKNKISCQDDPETLFYDSCGNFGETPLYTACAKGHLNIAELLIKKGVSVHPQEGDEGHVDTPFAKIYACWFDPNVDRACKKNYIALACKLFAHGATVGEDDYKGFFNKKAFKTAKMWGRFYSPDKNARRQFDVSVAKYIETKGLPGINQLLAVAKQRYGCKEVGRKLVSLQTHLRTLQGKPKKDHGLRMARHDKPVPSEIIRNIVSYIP